MVRLILCVSVVFVVLLKEQACFGEWVRNSYAFGRVFSSKITDEAIAKTPRWRKKDENPPLSARCAKRLADRARKKLVKNRDGFIWKFERLTLRPAIDDRWYWEAYYEAHIQYGGSSGIPAHLHVFVLMDGTVVKPTRSKNKRGFSHTDWSP